MAKKIPFRAGEACRRLQIQTRTTTQDAYGEAIPTWVTVDTRRGILDPLSGAELIEAQKVQSNATHQGRIRYSHHLTPQARIVEVDARDGTSRTLEPFDIRIEGRKEKQTFFARELVA